MRLALAEYGVPVELIDEAALGPEPGHLRAQSGRHACRSISRTRRRPSAASRPSANISRRRRAGAHPLIPGDACERAEVRRLTGWFDTQILCGGFGARHHRKSHPALPAARSRRRRRRTWRGCARLWSRLRDHLDYIGASGRPPHLAGGRAIFRIADLAAAAHHLGQSTISAIFRGRIIRLPSPGTSGSNRGPSFRPLLADTVRGMAPAPHYADLDF